MLYTIFHDKISLHFLGFEGKNSTLKKDNEKDLPD